MTQVEQTLRRLACLCLFLPLGFEYVVQRSYGLEAFYWQVLPGAIVGNCVVAFLILRASRRILAAMCGMAIVGAAFAFFYGGPFTSESLAVAGPTTVAWLLVIAAVVFGEPEAPPTHAEPQASSTTP